MPGWPCAETWLRTRAFVASVPVAAKNDAIAEPTVLGRMTTKTVAPETSARYDGGTAVVSRAVDADLSNSSAGWLFSPTAEAWKTGWRETSDWLSVIPDTGSDHALTWSPSASPRSAARHRESRVAEGTAGGSVAVVELEGDVVVVVVVVAVRVVVVGAVVVVVVVVGWSWSVVVVVGCRRGAWSWSSAPS